MYPAFIICMCIGVSHSSLHRKCDGPHLFVHLIFWNCCWEASLVWRFHISRLRRWHSNTTEGAGVVFPPISRGIKKENKFSSRQHQQRHEGTGEGFQWLRDHISLSEDSISVHSIHAGKLLILSSRGPDAFFSVDPCTHLSYPETHIRTHKKINIFKKISLMIIYSFSLLSIIS